MSINYTTLLFSPLSKQRCSLSLVCFGLLSSASSWMANAEAEPVESPVDLDVAQLDVFVVTGQPVAIEASAASVSLISEEEIEQRNALRVSDVLATVPGVYFSGLNGPREVVQIRSGLAFDNRTLFVEDGVPLQSSVFYDQSALGYSTALASPGSIEVFRGPGSALYGSDAFSGVIAINSKATEQRITGDARIRAGEYGLYDSAASVNLPINDAQAIRFTAATAGEEGFRDETGFYRAHGLVRHELDNGQWHAQSLLTYTRSETESATAIPLPDFEAGEIFASGLSPLLNPDEAREQVEYFRLQTKVSRNVLSELGEAEWVWTPYYRSQQLSSTLTFQPATAPRERVDVDTLGLLSRLYLDHDNDSQTIFGFDIEQTQLALLLEQSNEDTLVNGNLFRQGPQFDYQVDFTGLSPYFQHQRQLSDNLMLTLGLRYDRLKYRFNNHLDEIPGDARLQVQDRTDHLDALSPKARLLWQFMENQSLFFRYAEGFRTPRASELYELDANQTEFRLQPETADSYEMGWRAYWPKYELSTELIGYWQQTKDGVVTLRDTAAGDQRINAGSSRFAGIELVANASLGYGFDGQLTFAWQDFRYRQFGAETGSAFDGNRIEEAPRTLGNLVLNWVPPANESIKTTAQLRHIGRWPLNPANRIETDNEYVLNLLGQWQVNRHVVLECRIDNVTDNRYVVFADAPFFAPEGRVRPGQPRTFSAGVKFVF